MFLEEEKLNIISKLNDDFSENFFEVCLTNFCRSKDNDFQNHPDFLTFSSKMYCHF